MSSQGSVSFVLIGCVSVLFILSCMYLINPNYIHTQFTGSFQPIYMDLDKLDGYNTPNKFMGSSKAKSHLTMSPQTGLCRFREDELHTLIWSHRAHQAEWHLTGPDSPTTPLEELTTLLKHGIVNYDIDVSFISKALKEKSGISSSYLVVHPTLLKEYLQYEEVKRTEMLKSLLTLDDFLDIVETTTSKHNTRISYDHHLDGHIGGDIYRNGNKKKRAPLVSIELKFNNEAEIAYVFEHILNTNEFRRQHVVPITSTVQRLALFEEHMAQYLPIPSDDNAEKTKESSSNMKTAGGSDYALVVNEKLQQLFIKNGYPSPVVHTGNHINNEGIIGLALRSQGMPVTSDGGGKQEELLTIAQYWQPNWMLTGATDGGKGEPEKTDTPIPTPAHSTQSHLSSYAIGSQKTSYSRISTAYYGDGQTACCTVAPIYSNHYNQIVFLDQHLLASAESTTATTTTTTTTTTTSTRNANGSGNGGGIVREATAISQWRQGSLYASYCHRVGTLMVSWVIDDVNTLRKHLVQHALDGVITNRPIRMLKEVKDLYQEECK